MLMLRIRRGLEDESPAARGSALLSLELLSRDGPAPVNADRSLLHTLASSDPNATIRRLAILCLKNGSPQRETILLLNAIADDVVFEVVDGEAVALQMAAGVYYQLSPVATTMWMSTSALIRWT